MDLWDAVGLGGGGVLACTGAGGKTSLIRSLTAGAETRHRPVLLTTTTRMYYNQVQEWPLVFSTDFTTGLIQVTDVLTRDPAVGWFAGRDGEKVTGLPSEWIERLAAVSPASWILIEADGAQGRWLKAPARHEPVVPAGTTLTVGVLNLQAVGQLLTTASVHRVPLAAGLLKKAAGQVLTWRDLAVLASHECGIFQYSRGRKVLVLAGATAAQAVLGIAISDYLRSVRSDLARCVLTAGYDRSMRPLAVYEL